MKDKFIIVNLDTMEYFKEVDGKTVKIFDDYDEAILHCGIYELPDAWICKLIYNYKEKL